MAVGEGGSAAQGGNDGGDISTINDLGLNAEEQAAFDSMRNASDVPVEGGQDDGAQIEERQAPVNDGQQQVEGQQQNDGGADDDDEDDGQQQVEGQQGQPEKRKKRVTFSRYEREVGTRDKTIAELQAKVAESDKFNARLAERLEIINEAFSKKPDAKQEAQNEDPEPNPEEDIFGWVAWSRREMGRQSEAANKRIEQLENMGRQADADRALNDAYAQDMQAFVAKEPNFVSAYQHLMSSRVAELAEYFFGVDVTAEGANLTPQQVGRIKQEVEREERGIVKKAMESGESASARIFRLARHRGWVAPAAQQKQDGQQQNGKQPGAQQQAAPGALDRDDGQQARPGNGKAVSVTDEIKRARQNVADSASLSSGGAAPTIELTMERLANMPEDEFRRIMDDVSPEKLAALMGGRPN